MIFPVVDAYLGLGSPYSYLASTQLDRIGAETGASFRWIPIAGPDLFAPGRNPLEGASPSGQYDKRYRADDAKAWADYYRVPFRDPVGRLAFDPALLARAALAVGYELRVAMMIRLFSAVFVDDRSKIEAVDCIDFAEEMGLNRHTFRNALADPMIDAEVLAVAEQAKARGVFGVPFFVADTRSFFGNDRLVLLSQYLRAQTSDGAPAASEAPSPASPDFEWAWPQIQRR